MRLNTLPISYLHVLMFTVSNCDVYSKQHNKQRPVVLLLEAVTL